MSGRNREPGDVHELASSYALNALDPSEKADFEDHLRLGCGECEAGLREFTQVADAIGQSFESAAPARVRERLFSRLNRAPQRPGILMHQSGLLISRSKEMAWQTMSPGIVYKPLYEDARRKYTTALVRMDPGTRYPSHRHSEIEELFLLSGDLNVEGQQMQTGDYCRADSGTVHGETFTDSGCVFLLLAAQENERLPQTVS
jgi:quercetin dioxygenase-like cupin family protein